MATPGDLIRRIPEFSAYATIKIAPDMAVPITARLRRIIDSKAFQRLRRIRQLSLSDRVFPSATHTRFSHGLGVYQNVLDYVRHLDGTTGFARHFEERDYLAILLAGLLHDLGHYPCAHQLDHVNPFPTHESLTVGLVEGRLVFEGENLADLIWDTFKIEPEAITRFFGATRTLPDHLMLLRQIIDSPVDADKCDYLPRDSYYCGVDYGTGFDRERFIRNLIPARDGRRLSVREKGLMSAERFQLARYWMYRSVYWGHTVRALITMLAKACEYFRAIPDPASFEPLLLTFNDHNFLDWLYGMVTGPGRELVEMVHLRREPYKRLLTVSYHHDPDSYLKLQEAANRDRITAWLTGWAARLGGEAEPHHLIWDSPPIYKTDTWESFLITLSTGEEKPIAKESPVIDALSQAFLHGVRKIRLFGHPRLAALVRKHRQGFPTVAELLANPG